MIFLKKCFFALIVGLFFSPSVMMLAMDDATFSDSERIATSFKDLSRRKQFEFFEQLEEINEKCKDDSSCVHGSIIQFMRYSWWDIKFLVLFRNINFFLGENIHKPWGGFLGWVFYRFSPTASKNEKKIRILQDIVKNNISKACSDPESAKTYSRVCAKFSTPKRHAGRNWRRA